MGGWQISLPRAKRAGSPNHALPNFVRCGVKGAISVLAPFAQRKGMVVAIGLNDPIKPYNRSKQHKKQSKNVVKEELRCQLMRLRAEKRKNDKLKKQRDNEKTRRKEVERALEQQRSDAATRELKLRLQIKLDDWVFYHDGSKRGERGEL